MSLLVRGGALRSADDADLRAAQRFVRAGCLDASSNAVVLGVQCTDAYAE
jgi:hypothetical protein